MSTAACTLSCCLRMAVSLSGPLAVRLFLLSGQQGLCAGPRTATSSLVASDKLDTVYALLQEFVINTPNNEASKFWIGGTGQHGKVCVLCSAAVAASAVDRL